MSSSATNQHATGAQQAVPSPAASSHHLAASAHPQLHNLHHMHAAHHAAHHHHQQTINSILNQAAFVQNANNLSINTSASFHPPQSQTPSTPSIQSPAGQSTSSSNTNPNLNSSASNTSNTGNQANNTTNNTQSNNTERYTSSETWTSVVHSLMCHLQSSDNEQFAKRAIESLAKKLKDKPDEMDALMTAVQKKGTLPTKCITIPRTLDGRLQVAGRKGFPHVIYARLWRWPDLHKNELKHLPICAYPFDLKLDNVCVNPYHYQRVISPGFDLTGLTLSGRPFAGQFMPPPPQQANNSQHSPQLESSQSNNNEAPSIKLEPTSILDNKSSPSAPGSAQASLMQPPSAAAQQQSQVVNGQSTNGQSQNLAVNIQQQLGAQPNSASTPFLPQLPFGNLYIQNPQIANQANNQFYHTNGATANTPTAPANLILNNANLNHHNQLLNSNPSAGTPTTPNPNLMLYDSSSGSTNSLQIPVAIAQPQPRRVTQDWQGSYPTPSPYSSSSLLSNSHQSADIWLQEEYPEIDLNTPLPEYWCTITYFENDLLVGDIFKVRSAYHSVIIDGFFDSSREDRFCLGALTNVQRTNASEKARLHIGKGVQLENLPDGSVYVRCLSDYSAFFESYYLDRESAREPFDAVHKIYPGSYVKVFSLKECLRCLKSAALEQQANNQQQQQQQTQNGQMIMNNMNSNGPGGIDIDQLRKLCRLRFSFVKGWGPDYPRKSILDTPCWCEVQLNRPLQYLDQLINSLSLYINTNNAVYPD